MICFRKSKFSLKKMHLKMSSVKWWPFCLGLSVLDELSLTSWHGLIITLWQRQVQEIDKDTPYLTFTGEIRSVFCEYFGEKLNCAMTVLCNPHNQCKILSSSLEWHHNERDGISHHQHINCSLNPLFRCRSKKTSKLSWPLWGEFTGDRWIPFTKGQ